MNFDELDARMRTFETGHDICVLPGLYMIARVDGRGFTKLTKDRGFDKPFDPEFRDVMIDVAHSLMFDSGFNVVYGYTQSDEISILIHKDDNTFNRKLRKLNSILAGVASSAATVLLNEQVVFDCRISWMLSIDMIVDYFAWRMEDAHRNSLHGHCYWGLRKAGHTSGSATSTLHGMSTKDKQEFLFSTAGVNYNDLPTWQKRGVGLCWESYEKVGINPLTKEEVVAKRRRISPIGGLPRGEEYAKYIRNLVAE